MFTVENAECLEKAENNEIKPSTLQSVVFGPLFAFNSAHMCLTQKGLLCPFQEEKPLPACHLLFQL